MSVEGSSTQGATTEMPGPKFAPQQSPSALAGFFRLSAWSEPPTAITRPFRAGYPLIVPVFSLPVAATSTHPTTSTALVIAGSMTAKFQPVGPKPSPGEYCLKLMLITAAPLADAQLMPAATSTSVQLTNATGKMLAPPATPATPCALLKRPATRPAQHVPWPMMLGGPCGAPVGIMVSSRMPWFGMFRSGCAKSHPVSSTATVTPAPVPMSQPVVPGPPAWICVIAHCCAKKGSLGTAATGTSMG